MLKCGSIRRGKRQPFFQESLYDEHKTDRLVNVTIDTSGKREQEGEFDWSQLDSMPGLPQPSTDGRYILLLKPTEAGGFPYVLEPQSGKIWNLVDDNERPLYGLPFGWHPDSKRILFWVDAATYSGLWLIDVETNEYTIIALVDAPIQGAAASPDGQRVAYVAYEDQGENLLISDINGNIQQRISGAYKLFSWSPDGKYLLVLRGISGLFEQQVPADQSALGIVDLDAQKIRPLHIPFIRGYLFDAAWSPDGRYVAAVGSTPGEQFGCENKESQAADCRYVGTSIYVEDIETGEARSLVAGISPVWSPDGSMIAFLSMRSGSPEIWSIRRDGSELSQITFDGQDGHKSSYLAWMVAR